MLIDRGDGTINLCEMKFYNSTIELTSDMAGSLRNKREMLKRATKTKKHIFITMITTHGITPNKHSIGLVDNSITMEDLFQK